MTRSPIIDITRGTLLLLMTMTHLPTVWAARFGQPIGFISAAEGFVFLSAFLAGKIFVEQQERAGLQAATRWVLGRALSLYLAHLALLVVAFTVIAWIAVRYQRPAVRNLLDLYLQSPRKALFGSAILLYQPPLLDILPMYIVFLVGTAFVIRATSRWGWQRVLCGSVLIWVAAQFGIRNFVYSVIQRVTGWDAPLNETGAFDLFAWQFLWVLGLWFGALGFGQTRRVLATSRTALHLALGISCAMFLWRYYSGPDGFSDPARHLFWIDKWTLSPVRVVNFLAVVFALIGMRRHVLPQITFRLPPIEALGGASQWVFVAHIGSVLFLLCLVGDDDRPLGGAMGALVMVLGYLALFAAGAIYHRRRKRIYSSRARISAASKANNETGTIS
jgi:hypothetical protein